MNEVNIGALLIELSQAFKEMLTAYRAAIFLRFAAMNGPRNSECVCLKAKVESLLYLLLLLTLPRACARL